MRRKDFLVNHEIYHIFSRSIADFRILNNIGEFERMKQSVKYYQTENEMRLSDFIESKIVVREGFDYAINLVSKDKENLVQIIAYCFMPTHIHLVLKQLQDNGISNYMRKILESYSTYFNTKHRRKGPLWESRFKNVLVKKDEQLMHLTRCIHLNPVTASLVKKPEDWKFSSYGEYLSNVDGSVTLCQFDDILNIETTPYRKFVNERISYQKELAKIKSVIIEEI